MRIEIVEDYKELSKRLGTIILEELKKEGAIVLPSGDTPLGAYEYVLEEFKLNPFEIKATIFGLDEWCGLDRDDEGSCQYYMHKYLFDKLPLKDGQVIEFNAKALDLKEECQKMNQVIEKVKNFNLVVLGIGMNGHLGLNEPGTSFEKNAQIVNLSQRTKEVAQKYFKNKQKLEKGITLGIKNFLDAKKLILVAAGKKKKEIVKKIIESDVSEEIPATAAKLHNNSILLMDRLCID
ncbi:glucosamine-6-phosphate deaminase [Clostridium isatidis]|uniref:Glucosamine-6-phosphate deaminase n=2 Tax=Clostridium isatidis TaxID=182773 RepID=A0A343JEH1_9CLOT|nr:glucosamine-6-phosphate deaminase [Clostridium isatidis]